MSAKDIAARVSVRSQDRLLMPLPLPNERRYGSAALSVLLCAGLAFGCWLVSYAWAVAR